MSDNQTFDLVIKLKYSSLENNCKAQEDASKALKINKNNVKAIQAKAESLFSNGNFELGRYFKTSTMFYTV